MNSKRKGSLGEKIAEKYLLQKGYKILARNVKLKKLGEIDLVCEKDKTLNFVEVKSLFEPKDFSPEIHFNFRKQKKLKILSQALTTHFSYENYIISLICVIFKKGKIKIRYYENLVH